MESNKPALQYSWDSSWLKPYESEWSIFEKFKYANTANMKDILTTFGGEAISAKLSKPIYPSEWVTELSNMNQLSDEKLSDVFGVDFKLIIATQKKTIHILSQPTLRDNLYYCKKCLKYGYHSLFHQFKLVHYCPFHPNEKLLNYCPGCNMAIKYNLSDKTKGFECSCGHTFMNTKENYCLLWNKYKPVPVDQTIIKWLSLVSVEREVLNSFILPKRIDPETKPNLMKYLLSIIDPNNNTKHNLNAHTATANPKVMSQENLSNEYAEVMSIKHYDDRYRIKDKLEKKVFTEIYDSTKLTYNAVSSHLLKTVLRKHKSCIKRFFNFDVDVEPICPYAYAYVHWRKHIEGLYRFQDVDSYRIVNTKLEYNYLNTISKIDYDEMNHVLLEWERLNDYKNEREEVPVKFRCLSATKWVVNHVLYLLIVNHFYNWLKFAGEERHINKGHVYFYHMLPPQYKYKDLPYYLIRVPDKSKSQNSVEMHWWIENDLSKLKYSCPFDTVKKRRHRHTNSDANIFSGYI
ncbi:hypothetical protein [Cohnella terricola]|uniref:Uncharacterized protein n=1 Tax=Cohnella terricola TaxID=1289167 RepID=A0A559JQM5_9BACL|nr:hypothetical protein [Cohnella terricola]TVY02170.1 hypothetical protein FPZ45_06930 [Cohnella terricola]